MASARESRRPARTMLEHRIWELRQTQEEFAEFANAIARQHNVPATLSARHVQRLVAGRKLDGTPIGPLRPSTTRLLERIFGQSIDELLSPPSRHKQVTDVYPLQVAIAIVRRHDEVLLVSPRLEGAIRTAWQFPAGIVKPGVAPEAVAVRETLAETGVRCAVECGLGSRIHPETNVLCTYLLCAHVSGEASNLDLDENADVTWVRKVNLARLVPIERIYPPVLGVLDLVGV
jgi:8-oxo-dGTP pyrophosphatase MutT (NUDIX family)